MSDEVFTDQEKQIRENAVCIAYLAQNLITALQDYISLTDSRQAKSLAAKCTHDLHRLLRQTSQLVSENEDYLARSGQRIDTSDTMPCLLCNDHYPLAGEHVRGIRFEPIPGKGRIYICWECALSLQKVMNDQVNNLAYNLLFNHSKETQALRDSYVPEV